MSGTIVFQPKEGALFQDAREWMLALHLRYMRTNLVRRIFIISKADAPDDLDQRLTVGSCPVVRLVEDPRRFRL